MTVYSSATVATDNVAPVAELGESAYVPRNRLYLGLRYRFMIRDQIGNPLEIYVDRRDQIFTFIHGFAAILQQGQVVRFECDMLGLHGWLHGKSPENRNESGTRVMPRRGHPSFDVLVEAMGISPNRLEDLRIWQEYTAHNPDWHLRKMKERAKHHV